MRYKIPTITLFVALLSAMGCAARPMPEAPPPPPPGPSNQQVTNSTLPFTQITGKKRTDLAPEKRR